MTRLALFHRSHNTSFSFSSLSSVFQHVCIYVSVHGLSVFVSRCQWFSPAAFSFFLLAGCRVGREVKLELVIVVFGGVDKLSEECGLKSVYFCSCRPHMCPLTASTTIPCGLIFVSVRPFECHDCEISTFGLELKLPCKYF